MLLECKDLNSIYSQGTAYESHALRDVSLTIDSGEFLGVIGHTGSGKSTLIQHFNGLIRPTSGQVLFEGRDIWADGFRLQELRFKVGLVFQYPEYQLFENDVLTDVCFGPKNKGLSKEEQEEKAILSLQQVGVDESLYRKSPFELSGGQKRRVAIAGVLAMEPDMLVLDEPTAGLDPRGCREILDRIEQLQKERGITVILVSHSMDDMARYVNRLIVMDQGRKVFDAPTKEVFSHTEELEGMGLAAPQMTYIMRELSARGWPVDRSAGTVKEAKNSILQALEKR